MPLQIIGELINNSYARARRAFTDRDIAAYQKLAVRQTELGAAFLTLNLDGTQRLQVRLEEMMAFLPEVIAGIQEVTTTPISFDNPSIRYHEVALAHYDRAKGGRPILNSIAASRHDVDGMIALSREHDTHVIVMASEHYVDGASAQCLSPQDAHRATRHFVERLVREADRTLDQIIVDPGLAPVGADTYGLVNIGLDAMRLIRADPDLAGIHLMVGLSNFAWGTPKGVREQLERAYLTLGIEAGLDFALANPEKDPSPLPADDPTVAQLRLALAQGRPEADEAQEVAGYRQAEAIMAICASAREEEDDEEW